MRCKEWVAKVGPHRVGRRGFRRTWVAQHLSQRVGHAGVVDTNLQNSTDHTKHKSQNALLFDDFLEGRNALLQTSRNCDEDEYR